jgi:hypothetical protein
MWCRGFGRTLGRRYEVGVRYARCGGGEFPCRRRRVERLVHSPVIGRPVVALGVDKASIKGGKKPPALIMRDHHWPAHRRSRRLRTTQVIRERRARVVKPRDIRGNARVGALRAKPRNENRGASLNQWTCAPPYPLARERMPEHRLDPGRPTRNQLASRRLGSRSGSRRFSRSGSRIRASASPGAQDCSECPQSDHRDQHNHEDDQSLTPPPHLGSVSALLALRLDALRNPRVGHGVAQA